MLFDMTMQRYEAVGALACIIPFYDRNPNFCRFFCFFFILIHFFGNFAIEI